jgi:plastocyanin
VGDRVLIRGAIVAAAIGLATASARAEPGGRVVGKVRVTEADGKPATGVEIIVYVVGFEEPPATPGAATAQVAQQERKFVPDLVAITVGETVSFPNNDPFMHNVFSQSTARKFDLGSYKKGDPKSKDFRTAGVVDVYCNIHPEMAATILVLPNRRHVRASPDGTFAIDGVKPGKWTVFAYARRATKPASAPVTVAASTDAAVELAIVRGAEPKHVNKYGEKYKDPTTPYH